MGNHSPSGVAALEEADLSRGKGGTPFPPTQRFDGGLSPDRPRRWKGHRRQDRGQREKGPPGLRAGNGDGADGNRCAGGRAAAVRPLVAEVIPAAGGVRIPPDRVQCRTARFKADGAMHHIAFRHGMRRGFRTSCPAPMRSGLGRFPDLDARAGLDDGLLEIHKARRISSGILPRTTGSARREAGYFAARLAALARLAGGMVPWFCGGTNGLSPRSSSAGGGKDEGRVSP